MMTIIMCVTLGHARWIYVRDDIDFYVEGLQQDPYSSSLSKRCTEKNRVCIICMKTSNCCDGMTCYKQKCLTDREAETEALSSFLKPPTESIMGAGRLEAFLNHILGWNFADSN